MSCTFSGDACSAREETEYAIWCCAVQMGAVRTEARSTSQSSVPRTQVLLVRAGPWTDFRGARRKRRDLWRISIMILGSGSWLFGTWTAGILGQRRDDGSMAPWLTNPCEPERADNKMDTLCIQPRIQWAGAQERQRAAAVSDS